MAQDLGEGASVAAATLASVVWTDTALADLASIDNYIHQFNPTAAAKVANSLSEAANSLEEFPERGHPIGRGYRDLVAIWPYLIRYRIVEDTAIILRIRHGMRDPT